MRKTVLTDVDYTNFYKAVLYGKIEDSIDTSLRAAYRDLCRTIRGFAKHPNHDQIFRTCETVIYDDVTRLLKYKKMNQETYDKWHEITCKRLITFSNEILTYGQAQKWINMTLKYQSMFDHKRTETTYEFYHVPIDNYILNATKYKLSCAWSKLKNYEEYLAFQKWFRDHYKGIPLDEEFKMWLEEGKYKK